MGWGLPGVKFSAQSSLSSFSWLEDQVALVAIYPHTEQFQEYWALTPHVYLSATNKCVEQVLLGPRSKPPSMERSALHLDSDIYPSKAKIQG